MEWFIMDLLLAGLNFCCYKINHDLGNKNSSRFSFVTGIFMLIAAGWQLSKII